MVVTLLNLSLIIYSHSTVALFCCVSRFRLSTAWLEDSSSLVCQPAYQCCICCHYIAGIIMRSVPCRPEYCGRPGRVIAVPQPQIKPQPRPPDAASSASVFSARCPVAAGGSRGSSLSQCVYSGSISGSIFMLSIIQLVASPPGPRCLAGSRFTGAMQ